jgi:2-isopropylmalate synthase
MRRDAVMQKGAEGKSVCEATVRVRVGNEVAHRVAEGDGPVNALDSALRLALGKFFPKLKKVQLTDYKVRILDGEKVQPISTLGTESESGTASKTRVLIESTDGKDDWGTVGVSTNIIEASLQALVDSLEYGLLKKKK